MLFDMRVLSPLIPILVFGTLAGQESTMLFPRDAAAVTVSGGSMETVEDRLRIRLDASADAQATIVLPPAMHDLRGMQRFAIDLQNLLPSDLDLDLVLEDEDGRTLTSKVFMYPRQTIQPIISLARNRHVLDRDLGLVGMRTAPQPVEADFAHDRVRRVIIRPRPTMGADGIIASDFALLRVAPQEPTVALPAEDFLPFVDRYGQFVHVDWPDKTRSDADLRAALVREEADLAAHPPQGARTIYGGWLDGPQLAATGRFRSERWNGRWWLVDPEGRLFWSQGINCVRPSGTTGITGREDYFAWLPTADDPLAAYLHQDWPRAGWYASAYPGQQISGFNHTEANLHRRHGLDWQTVYPELMARRLASWGITTIAAWSQTDILTVRRIPYVATIYLGWPAIAGGKHQIPDPFHPDFRPRVAAALASLAAHTPGDPWCLGYFVDNEIKWGGPTKAAAEALRSPAEQPAKQAVIAELRQHYVDIAALNAAWDSAFADWEALAASSEAPPPAAAADLERATRLIADAYFRTCREEIERHDPGGLYLGVRFFWRNHPDPVVRAAAEHCDVLSYNRYDRDVAPFQLPAGIDRPVLITEYHFGATDRGMFSSGLNGAVDQADRARLYRGFVRSALDHPQIVGAHWFALHDQPLTGRPMDEENFQHGFLDVCDRPYQLMVDAARELAAEMYPRRAGVEEAVP